MAGLGRRAQGRPWATIESTARGDLLRQREHYFDWLIGWLAYCVQHPGRQAEVAVVLRGLKGTGKGMVGQMLMRIFRNHSLHITHSKHLVGNFNAHLVDALFLFLDEAFWAGDKQGEGTLKALITERTLMIEPKGVDSFPMPNRLKILMASNNDWVVPASADERRYFVLDVPDTRKGDKAYFIGWPRRSRATSCRHCSTTCSSSISRTLTECCCLMPSTRTNRPAVVFSLAGALPPWSIRAEETKCAPSPRDPILCRSGRSLARIPAITRLSGGPAATLGAVPVQSRRSNQLGNPHARDAGTAPAPADAGS